MLQIIFLSVFIGVVMLALGDRVRSFKTVIIQGNELITKAVGIVCKVLPIFIFTSLLSIFWTLGFDVFLSLWKPIVVTVVLSFILAAVTLLYVSIRHRVSPFKLVRGLAKGTFVSFTTASSVVAYATIKEDLTKNLGLEEQFVDFTYPIGLNLYTAGYMLSGEWQGEPGENRSELFYETDSVRSEVHVCKWCDTWKKYDLLSYGPLYCQYIDKAIAEGFDGDFTLHVKSILSAGDAVCTFVWDQPADETAVADIRKKRQESLIRPFSFHCAELLRCTKEILEETVPQKSMEILSLTENDFRTLKPEAAEFFVQNDSDNVF